MISIFDLFSIGIGPSSSHTVGPMRAAHRFIQVCPVDRCARITVEIFGSLAYTGQGHGTDKAILAGLSGALPESVDPDQLDTLLQAVLVTQTLILNKTKKLNFDFTKDFIFNCNHILPYHPNGMRFTAYDKTGDILLAKVAYSIGGGFVVHEGEKLSDEFNENQHAVPYPFDTAESLFAHCRAQQCTIAEIMFQNELAFRDAETVREGILHIAEVMRASIRRGCETEGILPGGLEVKRRAPALYRKLSEKHRPVDYHHIDSLDWLSTFAIAVNEENAAGKRVVTAPTNGAAGVIPAVMHYYETFYHDVGPQKIIDFLLTAAAIAVLYKKGASISAAEVGCQGEVGVASSMAAGALTAVLGGDLLQIENAAEIAMEHSLGLTCDPIAGLVQIPCIERNAVGAAKAVNVTRLALLETGIDKKVSLDKVIDTMKRTGHDMSDMYKETSRGGLAKIRVNVIEC